MIAILHKKDILDRRVFATIEEARNYLCFKYPNKKWKKEEFTFTCLSFGVKFVFVEVFLKNQNENS